MPFTLTMPKLSPTMEEGTIAKWRKKEGDFVKAGEVLFEVATDKATVEYNALDEGFVRKILKKRMRALKVTNLKAFLRLQSPRPLFLLRKNQKPNKLHQNHLRALDCSSQPLFLKRLLKITNLKVQPELFKAEF
jgi:hypothetical protein